MTCALPLILAFALALALAFAAASLAAWFVCTSIHEMAATQTSPVAQRHFVRPLESSWRSKRIDKTVLPPWSSFHS